MGQLVHSLPEREFGFALFFGFHAWSEKLLEKSFFDETVDNAVVDGLAKIVSFHLSCEDGVGLLRDHGLDGCRHYVRHALETVRFRIRVVDAIQIGVGLLVVNLIRLDSEGPIFIEALDGLGVGLDDFFGQLGVRRDGAFTEQISRGDENIVKLSQIAQVLIA